MRCPARRLHITTVLVKIKIETQEDEEDDDDEEEDDEGLLL